MIIHEEGLSDFIVKHNIEDRHGIASWGVKSEAHLFVKYFQGVVDKLHVVADENSVLFDLGLGFICLVLVFQLKVQGVKD